MKQITFGIKKITIIESAGSMDKILIYTNLAPTIALETELVLKMDARPGEGYQYVIDHFGIEPRVIGM